MGEASCVCQRRAKSAVLVQQRNGAQRMIRRYAQHCSMTYSKFIDLALKRCAGGYLRQQLPAKFDNVIVAMSSGVDSSVAAALFAGFPNAKGIYMQNWSKSQSLDDPSKEPCYERDWKDVCAVAEHLNLPVDRVNFEKDYWIDVFEPMLEQYSQGLTPNPDIGCNRFVKFGRLREHLDRQYGGNNYWLVTGHYARVLRDQKSQDAHLLRGLHREKDQSYYLSQISPAVLPQLLLPMGCLTKPEVRELAKALGLPTAAKPDSQGICFVNNSQHGKFKHFLEHYLPSSRGNVVTVDPGTGEKHVWGQHPGLWSYTIGQKVGISMPQGDPQYKGAWFVSDKLHHTNEIVIVRGRDHPALFKDALRVDAFLPLGNAHEIREAIQNSIHSGGSSGSGSSSSGLTMQYRSLQAPVGVASCHWVGDTLTLKLQHRQRAIAPGQYCCLYLGDRVLGSGVISNVE